MLHGLSLPVLVGDAEERWSLAGATESVADCFEAHDVTFEVVEHLVVDVSTLDGDLRYVLTARIMCRRRKVVLLSALPVASYYQEGRRSHKDSRRQ